MKTPLPVAILIVISLPKPAPGNSTTLFKLRNRSKLFFKSHFWQLGNLLALFVLICELRNKIMFLFFYLGSRQFPFFSAQYIKSYIYRQNIRFSNINFVAKSSGFLSSPQKYDETYQSIKQLGDFPKWFWPNQKYRSLILSFPQVSKWKHWLFIHMNEKFYLFHLEIFLSTVLLSCLVCSSFPDLTIRNSFLKKCSQPFAVSTR